MRDNDYCFNFFISANILIIASSFFSSSALVASSNIKMSVSRSNSRTNADAVAGLPRVLLLFLRRLGLNDQ